MKDLKNYQLINVKYLGATNFRGSRVKLSDPRMKTSKIIPFDYQLNRIEEMAQKYLTSIGFVVIGQCEGGLLCDSYQGSFNKLV
jgi:hypothetical protein